MQNYHKFRTTKEVYLMLIFYSYNSINIKNTEQWRNWIILNNYFPIYFIEPNHFLISNYYNRIGLSGCHGLCSSRPTVTFTSAIWSLWWMKGWVDLWTLVVAIDPGSMLIFCSSHQWQCVALLSVTPHPYWLISFLVSFYSGLFASVWFLDAERKYCHEKGEKQ